MSDHRAISVLIPAYNEEALLPGVIAAIRTSFAAINWREYEIIVCDNNSTDDTAKVAEAAGAKVVFEEHQQISRARNAAAAAATGQWFIFIDADTYLSAELLSITIDNLSAGKICAGGAIVDLVGHHKPFLAKLLIALWNFISSTFNLAAGSYIYCTRKAYEGAGGFDTAVYAGEELNLARDIKRWARPHKLKFQVITAKHIQSSGRKLAWFSSRQMIIQILIAAIPGSRGKRNRLKFWYTRPDDK